MEHNFWFWILEAVTRWVLGWVTRVPEHEYWGLANMISGYTVEFLTIMLRYVGSFIGLAQLGVMVGIIITFEIILWIKRFAVDNIFTIIKFFL
jgi:hypothetical protein